MATPPTSIPQLTKDNYNSWCIRMTSILGSNTVWKAVEHGLDELLKAATNSKQQEDARTFKENCKEAVDSSGNGQGAQELSRGSASVGKHKGCKNSA
ncbi:hypothetical protein Droror1_Dr00020816 [Drosera rotundifolia]